MNISQIRVAILLLAIHCATPLGWAQNSPLPPGQLSYQGFLTDANGVPLATNAPKNYTLNFRLWTAPTGGTALWGEQQVVTVDRGYFTVMLGAGSAISGVTWTNDITGFFNAPDASSRYVGTTVTDLSPSEIVPRLRLLSSPYSLLSSYAVSAGSVAGANVISANNLATNIGLWTAAGNNVYRPSGNVGIGTSTPAFPLDFGATIGDKICLYPVGGANSYGLGIQGALLQLHTDTAGADIAFGYGSSASFTENMRIKGNGRVGIGTANPTENLTIANVQNYNSGLKLVGNSGGGVGLVLNNQNPGGHQYAIFSSGYGNTSGNGNFAIYDDSLGAWRLVITPNGNVGLNVTYPAYPFVVGSAYCTGTTWVNTSDKNMKDHFSDIDPAEVLNKVSSLPITMWKYKNDTNSIHLGPMAQDFYEEFKLGSDEKAIATIDEGGVALAAIKGLNQKLEAQVEEKDRELASVNDQLAAIRQEQKTTQAQLKALLEKLSEKE